MSVRFGESSMKSGASLISLIRRAMRVQSSSLIRPARMSASRIRASADSSRMTISLLLISREKTALVRPCLTEQERAKSSPSVELCVGTIVRPAWYLRRLIESDPYAPFGLPPQAKPVITFFRRPPETHLPLPIERDDASILAMTGSELLSAYVPGDKGPVFMLLIERAFGKDLTTRTLETVRKCAWA